MLFRSSIHRGLSNLKINSRQGPPEVPSNSKINYQTPSRTEIEILINYLKVWSQSDRKRAVNGIFGRDITKYTVYIYTVLANPTSSCTSFANTIPTQLAGTYELLSVTQTSSPPATSPIPATLTFSKNC